VWLTEGATPTPAISYSVVDKNAGGAVNITASHNPPTDSGFKVRDPRGAAIAPAQLKEIERLIPEEMADVHTMNLDDAMSDGLVQRFDPAPAYSTLLRRLVDLEPIRAAGYKVLVDCMWGNGAGWFPEVRQKCTKCTTSATHSFRTWSGRNRFRPTSTTASVT
jgi:phosphomannomutase